MKYLYSCLLAVLCLMTAGVNAQTTFIEAESFTVHGGGWRVNTNAQARQASLATALNGSAGDGQSTAVHDFTVSQGGAWRIWVRYMNHANYRGPFEVNVKQDDKLIAQKTFDQAAVPKTDSWTYVWASMDLTLQPGRYTLELAKFQHKNVTGYTRNVDCFLVTSDLKLIPDHVPYGPQTWMRVTLGQGYDEPVQIHIFADHYRDPWYAHFAISKDGMEHGLNPKRKEAKLDNGQSTGWVNISQTIYQDSGAHLHIYPAYTYSKVAKRFTGTIDIATQADDAAIVRTFHIDQEPATLHMVVPGRMDTPQSIAQLGIDQEFADKVGAVADAFDWPTIGRKPEKFLYFISTSLNDKTMSSQVVERELKTLDYFGFTPLAMQSVSRKPAVPYQMIGGVGWFYKDTFSNPETQRIEKRAAALHDAQLKAGLQAKDIAIAMVMDEPTGMPASKIVKDEPSRQAFVQWLKRKNLTPQDLLVKSWDDVKLVVESQRDAFPALHYYTQQFRTVALGDFIALQKKLLHANWQADFPVNVNLSDGAVYFGNFYGQGVDYFTLLRETDQNAIWSEDWSNVSSTYQLAAYNIELMRAASRTGHQHMGSYVIAYAGRKGFDIRLKTVSEVARGAKALKSYSYGPRWAGHDASSWEPHTEIWKDHTLAVREIGAVEDMLLPAMPKPAQVALIYSSASDIWANGNNIHGFNRMHTWLALAHAQIPVDIVHEKQIEDGLLDGYKVAYLSGPQITHAAADKLVAWVKAGNTLILTAGAGQFDEYNRPLPTLDALLAFHRDKLQNLQILNSGSRNITSLKTFDTATQNNTAIAVLGAKQTFSDLKPTSNQKVLGQFKDGSPAAMAANVGQGHLIVYGYLPALDYIQQALVARAAAKETQDNNGEAESEDGIPRNEAILASQPQVKSYNPWQYPAAVRQVIVEPVSQARLDLPLHCSVPLVDAVYMTCDSGILIPLANYTLHPIKAMTLELAVDRPYKEVRSVHQGVLQATRINDKRISVTLPLDCTDYVSVIY